MSKCNHDCKNCNQKDCKERLSFSLYKDSKIKNTIGIVSAKGGVGKSLVTSILAVKKQKEGNKVAILDADITGPSIPKAFNVNGPLYANDGAIIPLVSKSGIKMVSASNLLDHNTQPILWRGPLLAGMIKQFYTEVNYGELDYLFIDMPPGTADVSLTIFQSLNLNGIIIVTTPQDLVNEIVSKTIEMANKMNIKVLGIIENMAYFECTKCHERLEIFGRSHVEEIAKKYQLNILGKIPLNPNLTHLMDKGLIEEIKDLNFIKY